MKSIHKHPFLATGLVAVLTLSLPTLASADRNDGGRNRSSDFRGQSRGRGEREDRSWQGRSSGVRDPSRLRGITDPREDIRFQSGDWRDRDGHPAPPLTNPRAGPGGEWRPTDRGSTDWHWGAGYGNSHDDGSYPPSTRYRYRGGRSYGRPEVIPFSRHNLYTPNFPRPHFIFGRGFTLGVAIASSPPYGYSYYDPYCDRYFNTLDDYFFEPCHGVDHPAIEVIDDRTGVAVAMVGFHNGRWIVEDAY